MRRRVVLAIVLIVLVGLGAPTIAAVVYAHKGYRDAEELLVHQLWPQGRKRLADYLILHPHDAQARLLMAEAFVKDDSLPAGEAALQAIQHLAQIADGSPHAAEARFREGGYYFLLLQKPGLAEQRLRKSIDLGAGLKAHQLLWTLLNFTGRLEETEPVFWRIYEMTPEDERPLRLREWFMFYFFPNLANEYLDRQMGVIEASEAPTRSTESRRYLRFREREPESPANHAAVAQWCQQEGDPDFAKRLLDAAEDLPGAKSDPFFLSVSIATHLDLGEFDRAEASFRGWPEHDRGHAYWKWRGTILDEVHHQPEAALQAYERALGLWPGPTNLELHHRRALCLTRLGRTEEAAAANDRTAKLKPLMRDEPLNRMRAALDSLSDPEQLQELVILYRSLGRDREADGWEAYIGRVPGATPKPP